MIHLTADQLPTVMQCNGSRLMPRALPPSDDPGSTRQEGIAAHYMALSVFNGVVSDASELVDRRAPNGVYMTAEMAEHVSEYLDVMSGRPDVQIVYMEHETYFTDHRTFAVKGRADRIIWNHVASSLTIDDFKYGWRLVEPDENWTLIFHAVAFCISEQITPEYVNFRIIQPRPFHPGGSSREITIGYAELLAKYHELCNRLSSLTEALQTGPACTTCHALANCPAARRAEMNAVEASEQAFTDELPDDVLSFTLDNLTRAKAMIDDRLKAFTELARHRIKSGAIIENYAVEPVIGNWTWIDGLTAENFGKFGDVVLTKPGLITVAQAIKAGVPEELKPVLAHRPTKGFKLVRENTNKRATRLLGGK